MIRKSYIKKFLLTYNRRLQKLKEQEAFYGRSIEPGILLEIEDIETKIEALREELKELEEFESFTDNSTLLMSNQKINSHPLECC